MSPGSAARLRKTSRPRKSCSASSTARRRSDAGSEIRETRIMATLTHRAPAREEPKTETRIASYLLAEYLERLGVEVVFGLCGHTNIAFLDAWARAGSVSCPRAMSRS